MRFVRNSRFYILLATIWVILWVYFIVRDSTRKRYIDEYKVLLSRDIEGKRAYAYGDYLFQYLKFCKDNLPGHSTYDLIGIESLSIDERRAVYYLYPLLRRDDAEYLLVFDNPSYKRDGYNTFKELDERRFILRKSNL